MTPAPSSSEQQNRSHKIKYKRGCKRLVSERDQANKQKREELKKELPKPPLDPRFEAAV